MTIIDAAKMILRTLFHVRIKVHALKSVLARRITNGKFINIIIIKNLKKEDEKDDKSDLTGVRNGVFVTQSVEISFPDALAV